MTLLTLALALATPVVEAAAYSEVLPIEALAERADRVVIGEVLGTRAELTRHGVVTIATFMVTETLRGKPAQVIDIRIPGGRYGQVELQVSGAPQVDTGDEMLLFLDGNHIVGLSQGAFLIEGELAWRPGRLGAFTAPARYSEWLAELPANGDYEAWAIEDIRAALR